MSILFSFITCCDVVAGGANSDSLLKELRVAKTNERKADLYMALSTEAMAGDYKNALSYAQEAVFFAQKDGGRALRMRAAKSLASVEFYIGLFDQAIIHFDEAADAAEQVGDDIEAANNRFNIALIYSALGDYKKCIRAMEAVRPELAGAYQKAGREFPRGDLASLQLNLGVACLGDGQLSLAHRYLDSAIALAENQPELTGTLYKLLITKAKARVREDSANEALRLLERADPLIDGQRDPANLILLLETKAETFEKLQRFPEALQTGKDGLQTARLVGSLQMGKAFAKGISRVYRRTGPSDSAIRYIDMVTEYDREAKAGSHREEMTRKELQDEFRKKERELVEREMTGRRRMIFGIILFSVVGLIAIFSVVYYRHHYRQARLQDVRRELESRRLSLESQRLQAELNKREAELEQINYQLRKNDLIELLVSKPDMPPATGQSIVQPMDVDKPRKSGDGSIAWQEFEYRFQQIHSGFYDRLNQAHPDLTLNERRLCAFLKLDMTTKEISDITGQTIHAIKMARIRLRRKLGLTHTDQEIFDYLSTL